VFAAADASTADADQAAEENLQLTSGRRDAWDRQQAQVAFELHDRLEQLRGNVGACSPTCIPCLVDSNVTLAELRR
jgi:hypothetical protein